MYAFFQWYHVCIFISSSCLFIILFIPIIISYDNPDFIHIHCGLEHELEYLKMTLCHQNISKTTPYEWFFFINVSPRLPQSMGDDQILWVNRWSRKRRSWISLHCFPLWSLWFSSEKTRMDFLQSSGGFQWEQESYPFSQDLLVIPLFALFFPSIRLFLDNSFSRYFHSSFYVCLFAFAHE